MLKGTLLTTIGLIGVFFCFFAPLGMGKPSPIKWLIYGVVTIFFLVLTAKGMNIRSKYISK